MDYSLPGSSIHGILQAKNTGMGCHALLQEIFPTQGLNPGLPHYRQMLYCLSHQGSLSHVQLLQLHGLGPTTLLCPWDFSGENTGLGCQSLLLKVFLTQGLKLSPMLQADSFTTESPGKPLKGLAYVE